MATQFTTKQSAVEAANNLRAKGRTVKVVRLEESRLYCQPFKGLVVSITKWWEVRTA